jgi:hypothetical protein
METKKSPYLKDRRLEDLIAAIQVMGVNPWGGSKDWSTKLDNPLSDNKWNDIFLQHPEFFRKSGDWIGLRWRYTYDKTYDGKKHRELTDAELAELTPADRENLTHKPLEASQIETLINTAIELHSHAIAHQEEMRWWQPVLIPSGLALLGTILGALATLGGVYLAYYFASLAK